MPTLSWESQVKVSVARYAHILKGLNVEQRKRLTIGVELAAKPELLLFLGFANTYPMKRTSS
jgi:hypothetical protein